MASSSSSSSSSLFRCFLHFFFFIISQVQAANLPFHPRDVLPLLPRQVSWPVLNSLNSPVDLLPSFVGSVSSSNRIVNWKGACFYENTAWVEFHNKTGSEFGGGTLHIKVSYPHSWTCMDLYVFATPYRVTWDYYFLSREHTLEIKEWQDKAEYEYVKNRGISIFLMQAGMLGTLQALWDVFPLFTNTGWGENSNIGFLEKHMGATFEERPQPWFTNISVDDVHSGDFLAISKIRGRWGGFETLEKKNITSHSSPIPSSPVIAIPHQNQRIAMQSLHRIKKKNITSHSCPSPLSLSKHLKPPHPIPISSFKDELLICNFTGKKKKKTEIGEMRKSFKDSLKALEANIHFTNTL